MGFKEDMIKKMRSETSDKQDLNQQALRFYKSLKEAEKVIGKGKSKEK